MIGQKIWKDLDNGNSGSLLILRPIINGMVLNPEVFSTFV